MKRFSALAVIFALFLLLAAPAVAQFNSNQNAGTAGGTANAIVLTVPNWARNLVNVPLYFIPASDNTGATTLIVNSVGSATAVQKMANSGLTALSGGEFRAGQTTSVMWDGTRWVLNQPLGAFVHSADYSTSALGFGFAVNLQLVGSVSTNALTIAVKTGSSGSASPADPTATTPVLIPFRDFTIANGNPRIVSVASSLSFTVASSNTMGCVSGQMCRLWVIAICSSGPDCQSGGVGSNAVGLCLFNALSGTSIAAINEAALATSASGTSGGSSAQTLYCNISAVTARSIRILGYVEIQEAAAGTWASGPTYVQLFGPGNKRPGETVQSAVTTTTTQGLTVNTAMGALSPTVAASAFSPTSAANIVRVTASSTGLQNTANIGATTQFQIARGATPIGNPYQISAIVTTGSVTVTVPVTMIAVDTPATTSGTTYSVFGKSSSGSATWGLTGTGSTIIVEEIMSALPEPANDNCSPEVRIIG